MKGDDYRERDRLEIDERPLSVDEGRAGAKDVYFPDHVTHESESTVKRKKGQRLVNRAESIMRQYPWVVITMGTGFGYLASRRGRLS